MKKEEILKTGEATAKKVNMVVFLLAGLKMLIGIISGSVALLSDAIHSIGDAFSIFFVWLGFKISQRKPTEQFPYGFYKAENLVSLMVSVLILYAGYEIARESCERISVLYSLKLPFIAIAISILDAFLIYLVGKYEVRVGREINSQSLIAHGTEAKSHIVSSFLVVVGILSSYLNIPKLEGIIGILFSLLIFRIGLESFKDSIYSLMDVSPSEEIEKRIADVLKSISEIKAFSGLKLRKSGPFIFGEVNIKIKKFIEVARAHDITDQIERKVKEAIPQIESFIIHIEPFKSFEQMIVVPIKQKSGLDSLISDSFARADSFILVKIKKNNIQSFEFKENPFKNKEIRAGLAVAEHLSKEEPDILITKEIGPIAFQSLKNNLIEVYKAEQDKVGEVIKQFFGNKLIKLDKPTKEKE